MRPDAAALLDFWEASRSAPPHRFADALLRMALPESEHAALSGMGLGERDRLLCEMRRAWFGARLESLNACSHCGAGMETDVDIDALLQAVPAPRAMEDWSWQGRAYALTPLRCADALAPAESAREGYAGLRPCLPAELSPGEVRGLLEDPEARASLESHLEALDPFAVIWIEASCPDCRQSQSFTLDPVEWLRYDLEKWSEALLEDIHLLARAYGWSEDGILRLPSLRRAWYRERLRS
jgi:hypothetical protein